MFDTECRESTFNQAVNKHCTQFNAADTAAAINSVCVYVYVCVCRSMSYLCMCRYSMASCKIHLIAQQTKLILPLPCMLL